MGNKDWGNFATRQTRERFSALLLTTMGQRQVTLPLFKPQCPPLKLEGPGPWRELKIMCPHYNMAQSRCSTNKGTLEIAPCREPPAQPPPPSHTEVYVWVGGTCCPFSQSYTWSYVCSFCKHFTKYLCLALWEVVEHQEECHMTPYSRSSDLVKEKDKKINIINTCVKFVK